VGSRPTLQSPLFASLSGRYAMKPRSAGHLHVSEVKWKTIQCTSLVQAQAKKLVCQLDMSFATTLGISNSDKEVIAEQISELYGSVVNPEMANATCRNLFSEYWRSIAF
jgi:hypothetical protein